MDKTPVVLSACQSEVWHGRWSTSARNRDADAVESVANVVTGDALVRWVFAQASPLSPTAVIKIPRA
jgi:hypothetical protein